MKQNRAAECEKWEARWREDIKLYMLGARLLICGWTDPENNVVYFLHVIA